MAKRGYKLQEFVAHASNVNCLSIGKKSCRVFVTGGEDRKVNLWQIGKPTSLLSLSGHTSPVESVTFDSAEGLVLGGASNGAVKLWDLEEAKVVRTLAGHRSKCTSLEFHPFGEFFASGSLNADLKVWDIRSKGCIHTYEGHTKGIRTIRFTPDGRWVVSGGEDNVVKVWDLTAGKLLHDFKFHSGVIQSIDFHPHEFLLATGSADRTAKFWDLETFELIGSSGPQATGVRSVIFHPDGKTLFCGSDENFKVFSWEPVMCHDDLDMGWSILGDLIIHEGKLLGCSYHQSSVGVWVVDISLIGPYAGGAMPESNGSMESALESMDGHTLKQKENSIKSFSTGFNGSDDQGIDVKEIIHTGSVTSNDICQKSLSKVGFAKAAKTTSRISTILRGNKGTVSCTQVRTVEESSASKSSNSNLTSARDRRARENCQATTRRTNSASKGSFLNSSRFSGSGLSNLKNDSETEMHRKTDIPAPSRNVSLPVIVPRDGQESKNLAKFRNDTVMSKTDGDGTMSYKPTHARRASYADGGIESRFNAKKPNSNLGEVVDPNFLHGFEASNRVKDADGRDQANDRPVEERFERVVFLDRSFGSQKEKSVETHHLDSEATRSLKYVKGVAIQHGRTKSLVESWEKRDRVSNNGTVENTVSLDATHNNGTVESTVSSDATPRPDNPLSSQNAQSSGRSLTIEDDGFQKAQSSGRSLTIEDDGFQKAQSSGRSLTIENDDFQKSQSFGRSLTIKDGDFPGILLQSRDLFINALKSRLTKLQMVRHCWEQNGLKGTISAIAKLPDQSVQVDVISILVEKVDLFNLVLFSCLLPLLVRLLASKTERHTEISLEMLLKLVRVFGPVVRSTMSAPSPVGIDIEAEQRRDHCSQCFVLLEKIKDILPPLMRRGGSIARHAMELNLALSQ